MSNNGTWLHPYSSEYGDCQKPSSLWRKIGTRWRCNDCGETWRIVRGVAKKHWERESDRRDRIRETVQQMRRRGAI